MRGAAPSITCPRCAKVAPPADVIGKFTTCLGCGMIFDAAAAERLVPVRKPKRALPAEPAEPAAPAPDTRELWRRPLKLWHALVIVVALLGVATIQVTYFPSDDDIARQAEIDEIQHANRVQRERYETQLGALGKVPATGVPSCDALTRLVIDNTCKSGRTRELLEATGAAVTRTANASGAVAGCEQGVAEITAARKRLACD